MMNFTMTELVDYVDGAVLDYTYARMGGYSEVDFSKEEIEVLIEYVNSLEPYFFPNEEVEFADPAMEWFHSVSEALDDSADCYYLVDEMFGY